MAGEPQGSEQGVTGLGLGDEEAHRMGAVDVLEDLGDRHHQPRGGSALGRERTEIDGHRVHVVEERVDRRQVRTALCRVGGLAFKVDHPAHGVVDLAGVEPEMRQRVREPLRRDARAQDRDGAAVVVVVRGGDGAGEPGQDRTGIGLGALALDDQGEGEAVDRLERGLGAEPWRHGELAVDGGKRALREVPDHLGGGHVGQVAHQAVELHPLRFDAVAQGVPPADIGAPVGVAADPARDGEGFRDELGPAVGPADPGRVEEGAVEGVEGRTAVVGRDAGLIELVVEADPGIGPGRERRRLRH